MKQPNIAYEINFDGIVGLTHHYGGLSFGNVASTLNESQTSNPKAAALQGLEKMKALHDLGLKQAVLPPHPRPYIPALKQMGFKGSDEAILKQCYQDAPDLLSAFSSASNMWVANAATISPSADTADHKVHITPANLTNKRHRAIEQPTTTRILKTIFSDEAYFKHHPALSCDMELGDEGAANHMRFCADYGASGIEMFVFGGHHLSSKPKPLCYPARQTKRASEAVIKSHQLDLKHTLLIQQNPAAIDQGVFHNDVIAINNKNVLLCHEQAWVNTDKAIKQLNQLADNLGMKLYTIKAKDSDFSVEDAVTSYVFNSQIVSLNSDDSQHAPTMAIMAPMESKQNPKVAMWLDQLLSDDNPITEVKFFDLKQSMRNGGGPACLRLRMTLTQNELNSIKPRVLMTDELHEELVKWVNKHYRDQLTLADLKDPSLLHESYTALDELTKLLELGNIYEFQQN